MMIIPRCSCLLSSASLRGYWSLFRGINNTSPNPTAFEVHLRKAYARRVHNSLLRHHDADSQQQNSGLRNRLSSQIFRSSVLSRFLNVTPILATGTSSYSFSSPVRASMASRPAAGSLAADKTALRKEVKRALRIMPANERQEEGKSMHACLVFYLTSPWKSRAPGMCGK